jgi:nicotinamidase-related amidase
VALTTLDPTTALVVIDLQKGVVGLPLAHPVESVVARSAALAAAFRVKGLPVALVNVSGGAPGRTEAGPPSFDRPADWTELVPELRAEPGDLLVTKTTWGAFGSTDLDSLLRDRGVTQVVVTGIATGSGVESTARQAHELGYNVTLATDAMTDRVLEVHKNSVGRIFPRLGETGSTADVLSLLG